MRGLAVALISLAVVACTGPTRQKSAIISERADAWEEAFQAGNLEALVALYTDDARLLSPNARLATGHEAVRAVFGSMIEAGLTGELTTIESVVSGELGYHVGSYVLRTADDQPADRGKFIEIWRLADGEWKISNDIFNSDLPAPDAFRGRTVMAVHAVEEPAKWRAAWAGAGGRRELFAEHGVPGVQVFQSPDDPRLTGLLLHVEDMDAFEALLASPEGRAAAKEDGVRMDTLRMLVNLD